MIIEARLVCEQRRAARCAKILRHDAVPEYWIAQGGDAELREALQVLDARFVAAEHELVVERVTHAVAGAFDAAPQLQRAGPRALHVTTRFRWCAGRGSAPGGR